MNGATESAGRFGLEASSGHRRSRTIGHFELFRTEPSLGSHHQVRGGDHFRLSLSPLSPPFELDTTKSSNLHPNTPRVRASRHSLSTTSGSLPPQSPSRKLAERLASPPTSPIRARSGLLRILTLPEDEEQQVSSDLARSGARGLGGSPSPHTNSSGQSRSHRRSLTLDTRRHHRYASTSAIVDSISALSRSTSLRTDRSDRYRRHDMRHDQRSPGGSSDELPYAMPSPSRDRDWTTRARRWSSSMSRRMSISAINDAISVTTSPYFKAGLEELRSIFDVDTIGTYDEAQGRYRLGVGDLEGCSTPNRRGSHPEQDDGDADDDVDIGDTGSGDRSDGIVSTGLGLYDERRGQGPSIFEFPRRSGLDALFDSPEAVSGRSSQNLSRQATVAQPRAQSPSAASCSTGPRRSDSDPGRAADSPANRQSSALVGGPLTDRSNFAEHSRVCPLSATSEDRSLKALSEASRLKAEHKGRLSTPTATALGLVGVAAGIVALCCLEASMHPDAASLPLLTFMAAQPIFAFAGLMGILTQRRWLMDLSSRLLRAHVLCQGLIALAAVRSLSSSAIYRRAAAPVATPSLDNKNELVARLRFSRFGVDCSGCGSASPAFDPATTPHQSSVGSLPDQITYILVFVVQAAVPLLAALWTQYVVAMRLASLASGSLGPMAAAASVNETALGRSRSTGLTGSPRSEPKTYQVAVASKDRAAALPKRSTNWNVAVEKVELVDFQLDAADLSSRLERVRRESLQAAEGVPLNSTDDGIAAPLAAAAN
ncbi:hypothetical protein ACQY0O_006240 [Thecaphora frezii]